MEDILAKYLTLPEYVRECEEEYARMPISCHHTSPGEKRVRCGECAEENRILSADNEV